MYNDKINTVLIFEAKDELEKLLSAEQAKKSSEVVIKLAKILKNKSENNFWKGRENYKIILSLLWGANDKRKIDSQKNKLFDYYQELVSSSGEVFSDIIIGVETLYHNDQLSCKAFYKDYCVEAQKIGKAIISSLIS